MGMERWKKLLLILALLFVASAAVFITAFTPLGVNAAKPGECPVDRATGIGQCRDTIPEPERGVKIPETCVKACIAANGFAASFPDAQDIYCVGVTEDLRCPGVRITPGAEPGTPGDEPLIGVSLVDIGFAETLEKIEEEKKAGQEECKGFLNVGCWIARLISTVTGLVAGIFDLLIAPIAGAVKLLAGAVARLMGIAIAYLSGITVTPGISTTPEFVTIGWNFTRSLANNFFILILAFIGLATILRLQAYQLQKTLPLLIIMALLVNFSGVLVGFFADIGTLVTNFFIQATAKTAWDNFGATFTKMSFWGGNPAASFATHIAEIIFYLIATLIYFVIILLFALRAVILWTLTMTAPLAFVLYILPATRRFFSDWWKQLIQWSLIGIPISFFLFLASMVLGGGAEPALHLSAAAPQAIASLAAPFTTFVLLFTGIAMSMAMAPAAAQGAINFGQKWGGRAAMATGSAAIRKFGTEGMQKFAENLRKRGQGQQIKDEDKTRLERIPGMGMLLGAIEKSTTRETLEKQLEKRRADERRRDELRAKAETLRQENKMLSVEEAQELRGINAGLNTIPSEQELLAQIERAPRRGGVGTAVARWGARTVGGGLEIGTKELTKRVGDKDIREYQEALKEVANIDSFMAFNMVNEELLKKGFANKNRILGLLNGVRERGDSDDIRDALDQGILDKKLIAETIKTGIRVGPPGFRPLLKSFYGHIFTDPREYGFDARLDEQGNVIERSGKDAKWLAQQQKSLPSKFRPQDLQGDTPDPDHWKLDSKDPKIRKAAETFVKMILEYRDADFMPQLARRERKVERDTIMQYIAKAGPFAESGLGEEWILEKAPAVLRYMTSTLARGAGVGLDLTPGEVNVKISVTQSLNRIQDEAVRKEIKSIVRNIQGVADKNLLAVANNLVQFESLRAPLVRLTAIQETRQRIERERSRGASQATINSLNQQIAKEEQIMRNQVAQAAGTSQNPTLLEDAWDRIEDRITQRMRRGRQ